MSRNGRITVLLSLSPIFIWGVFVAAGNAQAQESNVVPIPTIAISPDTYYPGDEVIYLEGRAEPNVTVEINFTRQGAKPRNVSTMSDANGEWVFAERLSLEAGDWEVRARTVAPDGRVSTWSNPRVFRAVPTSFSIGGVEVRYVFLVFSIIIVVLLIASGVIALALRNRKLHTELIRKDIRQAQESVRTGLGELARDLREELRMLETSGRALSPEELARREHLIRELEHVEQSVEHEISDIEERIR